MRLAIVSTHTLDSVNGSHAGGVGVELFRLDGSGLRVSLFETQTDAGGRLSQDVALDTAPVDARYELVFQTGLYFANHPSAGLAGRIVEEIVVRFRMPDPDARYHIPLMLAPNSCSVWWSD